MSDLIDRQDAIEALGEEPPVWYDGDDEIAERNQWRRDKAAIEAVPPACNESKQQATDSSDCISRQDAIDAINAYLGLSAVSRTIQNMTSIQEILENLPSAQPERTCVNCGRTVNNGGWYADGRTRCPIEEHYALPKDGYCHLWEKRNVTDDDYPERREE